MSIEVGSTLGGYRVEEILGRGAMGVVLRAVQPDLGRQVAIKVIAPQVAGNEPYRERFRREGRLAAAVEHPNAVPIYEAGVTDEDGLPYLVMRLVEGADLRALVMREGRLEPGRAARIVAQVAGALDAVHAAGLVHRDVKPANVLIEAANGDDHAYLTDFGLSKDLADAAMLTSTGQLIGTADYASPEQVMGKKLDARADVYALGCVLFEAVTGVVPFERESQVLKLFAHQSETPRRTSEVVPSLPAALDEVIATSLEKDPADRYQSAGELGRAAVAAATSSEQATGPSERPPEPAAGTRVTPVPVPAEPEPAEPDRGPPSTETRVTPRVTAEAAAAARESPPADPEPAAAATLESTPAAAAPEAPQLQASPSPAATPEVPPPSAGRRLPGWAGAALAGTLVAALIVGLILLLGGDGEDSDGSAAPAAATTPEIVDRFRTGPFPASVDVSGEGIVLIGDSEDGRVTTAAGSEEARGRRIAGDGQLVGLVEGPGELLYALFAAEDGSGAVHRLDPAALEEQGEPIATGAGPRAILATEDVVWVANGDDRSLTRLDAEGGVSTVEDVCELPRGLALGDDALLVACREDSTVRLLDPADGTELRSLFVAGEPLGVAEADGVVWVSDPGSDAIVGVDLETEEVKDVGVAEQPRELLFAFGSLWLTHGAAEDVWRLDPVSGERIGEPIHIGTPIEGIAAGPQDLLIAAGEGGEVVRVGPGG